MASSVELKLGPYFFLSLCVVCWIVDPSTQHQLECDTSTNQKQQVLLGLCYVRRYATRRPAAWLCLCTYSRYGVSCKGESLKPTQQPAGQLAQWAA